MLILRDLSELLLSKVNEDDIIFCSWDLFVQPGLKLESDISMSLYSEASIVQSSFLYAAFVDL